MVIKKIFLILRARMIKVPFVSSPSTMLRINSVKKYVQFSTHASGIRSKRTGICLFFFIIVAHFNFLIADAIIKQKNFVIVITSYNNAEWCVKNLETIFFQKNPDNTSFYQNYRVIIVDDASNDGNAEYIEQYIYCL